ncbi:hypothetical protein [Butyrivibrio fibrisolvens]|uniref:hypothetical protein n=1 Tax=Butyrivibrio fibrisolvens TaxID=831 RepID=UPI003B51AD77
MFLYRDDYYDNKSDRKGIAELIVARSRWRGYSTCEVGWNPQILRFVNLEKGH